MLNLENLVVGCMDCFAILTNSRNICATDIGDLNYFTAAATSRIIFVGVTYQYKVAFPDSVVVHRCLGWPDSMCSRGTPEISDNCDAQKDCQESFASLIHVVLLLPHD
jgi:hypothetical protein